MAEIRKNATIEVATDQVRPPMLHADGVAEPVLANIGQAVVARAVLQGFRDGLRACFLDADGWVLAKGPDAHLAVDARSNDPNFACAPNVEEQLVCNREQGILTLPLSGLCLSLYERHRSLIAFVCVPVCRTWVYGHTQ